MRTLLIVDADGLCHRAFHALPELSYEGVRTEVIFGVLRQVEALRERFAAGRVAWCFDSDRSLRRKIDPNYKAARRDESLDDGQLAARRGLREQIRRMRTDYLPLLGCRNVFHRAGYEADDVVASVVGRLVPTVAAVIVSDDGDLYQLLAGDRVVMWRPGRKSVYTEVTMREEYGIGPARWPDVKALAGCPGDGVRGIDGVGIKTAVKFLSGRLRDTCQAYRNIVRCDGLWRRNLELVRLPMAGVGRFRLAVDEATVERRDQLLGRLDIREIKGGVR